MVAGLDLAALRAAVTEHGAVVRVLVARVEGSAPREAGTAMLVWEDGQAGTVGGGALEWQAAAEARQLIPAPGPWARRELRLALGPALGQCCGGAVRLILERFAAAEVTALERLSEGGAGLLARPVASGEAPLAGVADPRAPIWVRRLVRAARAGAQDRALVLEGGWVAEPFAETPARLFLYGAGHVGRSLVRMLEGLPIRVTWIDDARARFPPQIPPHADMLVAANPADAVALAGPEALHLVMTYSHALDLEICHRVLSRPFVYLGLIGSASKAARFRSRLRALGHGNDQIARLTCPIGDPSIGKAPAAIALGVALELLRLGPAAARSAAREGVA